MTMGKSSAKKSNQCAVCHHSFGITRWRHTCSLCQRSVCDDCAPMSANNVINGENTIANNNNNDDITSSKGNVDSTGSRENVVNARICKNCKMYSNNNNDIREQMSNQLSLSNKANINRVHADRTCAAQESNKASLPVTMQRANPNDPAERERRAQVAEARLRAEQTRGITINNDKIGTRQSNTQISQAEYNGKSNSSNNSTSLAHTKTHVHHNTPSGNHSSNVNDDKYNNNNYNNENGRISTKSEESSVKSGEARRVGGTSPPAGSNPVLEAALRRQRQGALPCNNNAAAQFSAEKTKLLREIDNLLARHAGTAPFGLRSSDESKLRIYLNYLKEKYNGTA